MKKFHISLSIIICTLYISINASAQAPKELHVDGRYLKTADGTIVNMHGFAQTYSPWFNEQGTKWNNYNVNACLAYNKGLIDKILQVGWKMDFMRLHMDPYWSNTPGIQTTGEEDIHAFSMDRFKIYLEQVFVPMAEYAISKGMYVVMRPPGVCPQNIAIGDNYYKYLMQVWGYVAQHNKLRNNMAVMYELANEPVNIIQTGTSANKDLHDFFQAITDTIRHYCDNIILVPGTGWQSNYTAYGEYPITGKNIGYAVHCYPGWYNSGVEGNVSVNYNEFRNGWKQQIGPVADFAPVVVTEMDWAPEKYNASWGKAVTGMAGGSGFGANFKKITDECGNVSWLLFTWPHLLAQFTDKAPTSGKYTFLNDPEACPWPCYHWYQAYRDTTWEAKDPYASSSLFPLTNDDFNPSIWEQGSFNESTGCLITGQYGFGGWEYSTPKDLSKYKYLIIELKKPQSCGASFRIFDEQSYWSDPFMQDFGNNVELKVELATMKRNQSRAKCDASHIYRVGIWSYGGGEIYIKRVFLSDDGETPTGISDTELLIDNTEKIKDKSVFNLNGQRLSAPRRGINIINGKKYFMK